MRAADGKMRLTDCANTEQLLRIIQSIPSKKAEPFKQWLAMVGKERLDEMADPEKAMDRAVSYYKAKGYSDAWIAQRQTSSLMHGLERPYSNTSNLRACIKRIFAII